MRRVVVLRGLLALLRDRHLLGIRHAEAESPAEYLLLAPGRVALAHGHHVSSVAVEVAIAFVRFEVPEQSHSPEKVDARSVREQLAERQTADVRIRILALAEIALVDLAHDIAFSLVAIVDSPRPLRTALGRNIGLRPVHVAEGVAAADEKRRPAVALDQRTVGHHGIGAAECDVGEQGNPVADPPGRVHADRQPLGRSRGVFRALRRCLIGTDTVVVIRQIRVVIRPGDKGREGPAAPIEVIAIGNIDALAVVSVQRIGQPRHPEVAPVAVQCHFDPRIEGLPALAEAAVVCVAARVQFRESVASQGIEPDRSRVEDVHAAGRAMCVKAFAVVQVERYEIRPALFFVIRIPVQCLTEPQPPTEPRRAGRRVDERYHRNFLRRGRQHGG